MKGLNTLLELIETQKRLAIDRWGGVASKIEADLIDAAFQWIQDNIQIKDGIAEVNEDLPAKLSELQNEIVKIATRSKDYQQGITQFLDTIDQIQKNMTILHKEGNGINLRDIPGVSIAQNIVIEETINRYTENGLNTHFAAPLRELIYNNALAGTNMKQARAYLRDYIATGKDKSGKLYRYLTQTAQQATDSFTAAINVEIQKKFKTVGMIISGSIIETSSKQCIMAVDESKPTDGFLTNEQWEKILDVARNNKRAELIPGTTLTNLDLNKLHWGCRHGFFPLLKVPGIKKENTRSNAEVLKEVEDKIRPQDFESAAAVKDGKQLFFKDGEKSTVEFTNDEMELMNGAILTHNHPGSRSFSPADVMMFDKGQMQELRAVGRKADYSLTKTAEYEKLASTFNYRIEFREHIKRLYSKHNEQMMRELNGKINRNEITIDEANHMHHHRVMELLSKDLHLDYKRFER